MERQTWISLEKSWKALSNESGKKSVPLTAPRKSRLKKEAKNWNISTTKADSERAAESKITVVREKLRQKTWIIEELKYVQFFKEISCKRGNKGCQSARNVNYYQLEESILP